jgi:hypothetical protein
MNIFDDHVACMISAGWVGTFEAEIEKPQFYCELCHDEGCLSCDDALWYHAEDTVWKEHHPNWGIPGGEW